jgi:hypothetical protein
LVLVQVGEVDQVAAKMRALCMFFVEVQNVERCIARVRVIDTQI